MLISWLQAMRTPWFMKTFFQKLRRPSRAQEISPMLYLRDRIVRPSPTSIVPSELAAQGPSTVKSFPTEAQDCRKRHDHHRIFSFLHTAIVLSTGNAYRSSLVELFEDANNLVRSDS